MATGDEIRNHFYSSLFFAAYFTIPDDQRGKTLGNRGLHSVEISDFTENLSFDEFADLAKRNIRLLDTKMLSACQYIRNEYLSKSAA